MKTLGWIAALTLCIILALSFFTPKPDSPNSTSTTDKTQISQQKQGQEQKAQKGQRRGWETIKVPSSEWSRSIKIPPGRKLVWDANSPVIESYTKENGETGVIRSRNETPKDVARIRFKSKKENIEMKYRLTSK